jgi:hypothetical protein
MQSSNKKGIVKLGFWEEAVGVLQGWDIRCGLICFVRIDVSVPPEWLQRFSELDSLIGRRVAILRTDFPDRPWLIRAAEKTREMETSTVSRKHRS